MIATVLSLIALVLVSIWITLSDLRDVLRGADEHLKEQNPTEKNITNKEITAWSKEYIKKICSEEYTKGFNDAAFGGKLKEWSVEDEDRIRQIERIAQQAGCTQKLQEEIHDWFKSLRPKLKQEWNEEDERMLREIKRYIKEQGDKPTGLPNSTVAVSDMIAWLDILKCKDGSYQNMKEYV